MGVARAGGAAKGRLPGLRSFISIILDGNAAIAYGILSCVGGRRSLADVRCGEGSAQVGVRLRRRCGPVASMVMCVLIGVVAVAHRIRRVWCF